MTEKKPEMPRWEDFPTEQVTPVEPDKQERPEAPPTIDPRDMDRKLREGWKRRSPPRLPN